MLTRRELERDTVKSSSREHQKLEELAATSVVLMQKPRTYFENDYNAWVEAQSNPVLLLNILSHDQLVEPVKIKSSFKTEQHLRKIFKIHQRSQKS